jgi:ureidoacrylate peracid hydrolase
MLTTLAEKIDPTHAALIVVDIQNDFCHPECDFAKRGADMSGIQAAVERILELIDAARAAGTLVIFFQTHHTEITESDVWREQWVRSRPGGGPICRPGTWGADFYMVRPEPDEPIINKHRYTGFLDTDLDLILRSRGIKTMIMTGVGTGGCVESTARDGFMKDYYIVFTDDATATAAMDEHRARVKIIGKLFGQVCSSREIIDVWSRLSAAVPAD